ncbi:MAG: DUF2779 domain-containing protein [Bacilli bacterium]|nr:DUF2779 domain-containing protein [Bacilli bacterium]
MNISKTQFKKYTKCHRYYPLDQIYLKKLDSEIGDYEEDDIIDILSSMFDFETGDELFKVDAQTEAMLDFYKDVEREAIIQANKTFDGHFEYKESTKDQMKFSFTDEKGHTYYSYLDGYFENENEAIVIEVKATTTSKFRKMGYTEKKEFFSLFIDDDGVLKIRNNFEDSEKLLSSYEKLFDRYNEVGKYVFDIAIERYIIENSDKRAENKNYKYYLAVLNNKYVFDGKYDNGNAIYNQINGENLICFIDLTEVTSQYLPEIEKNRQKIVRYIEECKLTPYKMVPDCRVKKTDECHYFPVCWKRLKESGSILETIGKKEFIDEDKNKYSLEKMINLEYYSLGDVPYTWLKDDNKLIQRDCFDRNCEYIDERKILLGLDELRYPIYHLDFEGFPGPLPRFFGENPYSQSLFQFSLHIEKKPGECDFIKDRYSFLAKDFNDCREELVKELIRLIDLTNGGSVLVYNKSYEYTRISELSKIFPKYEKELQKINDSIFDLMDIVKSRSSLYQALGFDERESKRVNYYHNGLHGSYSIKKVLPLFSNLSYKDLVIANGTEAIVAYSRFKVLDREKIEELRQELITYCSQDTWSMVVVLAGIRKKCGV